MDSPMNQHCASCIGTLSFSIHYPSMGAERENGAEIGAERTENRVSGERRRKIRWFGGGVRSGAVSGCYRN